jgi:hypothetical protein
LKHFCKLYERNSKSEKEKEKKQKIYKGGRGGTEAAQP